MNTRGELIVETTTFEHAGEYVIEGNITGSNNIATSTQNGLMSTTQVVNLNTINDANGTLTQLSSSLLSPGNIVNTLWSLNIDPSTEIIAEIEAQFGTSSGKRWSGILQCTAERIASGTLVVNQQAMGSGLILTDPTWNPIFYPNGNTLELRITSDSAYAIIPTGMVRYKINNTSNYPILTLSESRANVLTDAPNQLYYFDTGLSPTNPTTGTLITSIADQSGLGHTWSFATNKQGKYQLDGSWPYLETTTAFQVQSTVSGNGINGSRTYRWTMDVVSASCAGEVLGLAADGIGFGGTSYNNAGSNVIFSGGGTWTSIGPRKAGKHIYEIRVDQIAQTVQLFVDGVAAASAISMTISSTAAAMVLGFPGYYVNCAMYGFCAQPGVGTTAQSERWIAMSEIAWGPHD